MWAFSAINFPLNTALAVFQGFWYAVFKKSISHVKRHTGSKYRDRRKFTKQIENKTKQKPPKTAGLAILVSDKTDFKPTKIKRNKEGHDIMVKGSIQQEELTILNIYAPDTGAPRFIKQVLRDLQRGLDSHTIILGDFNTPLSILDQ